MCQSKCLAPPLAGKFSGNPPLSGIWPGTWDAERRRRHDACDFTLLPDYAGEVSTDLSLLHGVRIALIHEIFLLIARMPRFSNQVISADDVINALLHLNIPYGVDILRRVFPVSEAIPDPEAFGEAATYRTDVDQGYEREHRELFDPMEDIFDIIRRIGTALSHITGAVG